MRQCVNSFASLIYLLFLSMLFGAAHAVAGPEPGKQFGNWLHECESGSEEKRICALTHTVHSTDSKGVILKLTIRKLGSEQTPVLVALVPLGIYLPAGVVAMVDSSPQFPLVVQRCTVQGCEAFSPLDPKQLWRLKAGKRLLIGFKARRGPSTVTLPVSLSGVSDGLQAMGWKGW
ncbi:MAG: invasion associated locus B family protein [Candidatus Sedimenticola sp. (ex Thyasira tokunagai)]